MRRQLILVIVTVFLFSGSLCLAACPSADLTGDCFVDYEDFALMANQWLTGDPCIPDDMACVLGVVFMMGDSLDEGMANERLHGVRLDSFYMGKYEITNQQYCDYLNSALSQGLITVTDGRVYTAGSGTSYPYCDTSTYSSYSQISYSGGIFSVRTKSVRDMSNDPMVQVSWYGAVAYCNWRSQQDGYEQCYDLSTWSCDFSKKGYRLPTEAEWEYAATGGLPGRRFPWGNTISQTQANFYSYTYSYDVSPQKNINHPLWSDGIYPYTSPVGFFDGTMKYRTEYQWPGSATSYQTTSGANNFGLHDMAGNVSEWCNDWDGAYGYSELATNPTGPSSGESRVMRGGCWGYPADYCRVAYRGIANPATRFNGLIGFRLVLDF